ncbi:hypothetical protein LWI29_034120 [Acer saccharum]|uniref:Uncharacterized protein n=1 Tax=Acer saccharum TaxID=4024 RepID=A0AA39W4X1_ACESA|nr:hypothetical protein LWI29_034120 [Acer saccharum]
MLLPPMEYLFNDIDREAVKSLLGKLSKEDYEFCKNKAEELFKQQNIDMAIYSISLAFVKNPKRMQTYHPYFKAYVVHKISSKVNNCQLPFEAVLLLPRRVLSIRLVNAAWAVLSQPKLREAYNKQLFSSTEFLEYV